jgi:hypothetical protein
VCRSGPLKLKLAAAHTGAAEDEPAAVPQDHLPAPAWPLGRWDEEWLPIVGTTAILAQLDGLWALDLHLHPRVTLVVVVLVFGHGCGRMQQAPYAKKRDRRQAIRNSAFSRR